MPRRCFLPVPELSRIPGISQAKFRSVYPGIPEELSLRQIDALIFHQSSVTVDHVRICLTGTKVTALPRRFPFATHRYLESLAGI